MQLKQTSLFKSSRSGTKKWWIEEQRVYGGAINYRKCARPFESNKLNHVVFKAQLGKSVWFTKSQKSISELLKTAAARYKLAIKSFSIQKDHIHLLCYFKAGATLKVRKKQFSRFLRFFSAEMGRKYKRIFRNLGLLKPKSLWVHRPFTRLVSWKKRSLQQIIQYIEKNENEKLNLVDYSPRNNRLDRFIRKWSLGDEAELDRGLSSA